MKLVSGGVAAGEATGVGRGAGGQRGVGRGAGRQLTRRRDGRAHDGRPAHPRRLRARSDEQGTRRASPTLVNVTATGTGGGVDVPAPAPPFGQLDGSPPREATAEGPRPSSCSFSSSSCPRSYGRGQHHLPPSRTKAEVRGLRPDTHANHPNVSRHALSVWGRAVCCFMRHTSDRTKVGDGGHRTDQRTRT